MTSVREFQDRVKVLERERGLSFRDALEAALEELICAEQERCAKIAEAFWDQSDKLNTDLRADLTQAEKSMAYMISTNIRALRRHLRETQEGRKT